MGKLVPWVLGQGTAGWLGGCLFLGNIGGDHAVLGKILEQSGASRQSRDSNATETGSEPHRNGSNVNFGKHFVGLLRL